MLMMMMMIMMMMMMMIMMLLMMINESVDAVPARAPASMAMLQMDILASIDSPRMASPANSMVAPVLKE
jgi:hypothetical protein